jgi:hypothetical protein
MESIEWSLLNASSDFSTMAITLSLDGAEPALERVRRVTRRMKRSVKTLERVGKVLGIGEAAVRLAGAILSGSPAAVAKALDEAVRASS